MVYMNESARGDVTACCTSCIHFDGAGCLLHRKRYAFAALMILSLGCLLTFIMAAAGVFHLSGSGLLVTGLGGSLLVGMLMLDCLKYSGCR